MVTYCKSSRCCAALLAPGEFSDPLLACRQLLAQSGQEPWPDLEAELYDLGSRLLLIVRPRGPLCAAASGPRVRLHRN